MFSSTLKNALAYYNAGVVVVNSEVVGLAQVFEDRVGRLRNNVKWYPLRLGVVRSSPASVVVCKRNNVTDFVSFLSSVTRLAEFPPIC
jgi:hypothetical protein